MDFRDICTEHPVELDLATYRSEPYWLARTAAALFLARLAATSFVSKHGQADKDTVDTLDELHERAEQALNVLEALHRQRPVSEAKLRFLQGMVGGHVEDLQRLKAQLDKDARNKELQALDAWLSGLQYWSYWSVVLSCNRHVEHALNLPTREQTEAQWQQVHWEIDHYKNLGDRVLLGSVTAEDRALLKALYRRWSTFLEKELFPDVLRRLGYSHPASGQG